jgi:hypothetical protein
MRQRRFRFEKRTLFRTAKLSSGNSTVLPALAGAKNYYYIVPEGVKELPRGRPRRNVRLWRRARLDPGLYFTARCREGGHEDLMCMILPVGVHAVFLELITS